MGMTLYRVLFIYFFFNFKPKKDILSPNIQNFGEALSRRSPWLYVSNASTKIDSNIEFNMDYFGKKFFISKIKEIEIDGI